MLSASRMQELEKRVKDVVCSICTERRPDGSCDLTATECPVTVHLPRLVDIATSVRSDSMAAYLQKVREEVCTVCRSPLFANGGCDFREEGHCALDAYLLPIIEVIDGSLKEWNLNGVRKGVA